MFTNRGDKHPCWTLGGWKDNIQRFDRYDWSSMARTDLVKKNVLSHALSFRNILKKLLWVGSSLLACQANGTVMILITHFSNI